MKDPSLVPVGKIVRTHGIRGFVKIYPYGESLAEQEAGDTLVLRPLVGTKETELTIVHLAPHGRLWLAQFKELASMDEAQAVVGGEVLLPEERLPATSEGEYYHYQLIGLIVETREGKPVGVLRGIIETGGSDVYAVERQGKEVLIPAVEEVICEVDLERGIMVIDPPEGLIDDL